MEKLGMDLGLMVHWYGTETENFFDVELVMNTVVNFCSADKVFLWGVKNEASEQNIKYH